MIGLTPTTVFANYELDPYLATAVTPGRLDDVLDLGVVEGSVAEPNAGEVMLSKDAAASMGVGVGDEVEIRLGDGTASCTHGRGRLRTLAGIRRCRVAVATRRRPPHRRRDLARAGRRRWRCRRPGRRWHDSRPITPALRPVVAKIVQAAEDANANTQAWVGYVLLGLVVVFCTFAVFNTLMLAISERGREFALLRLTGGTHRQVVTMMIMEAVMVVVTGLVLGTAIAAATVIPVAKAVTGSFQPHTPPPYIAAIVIMAAVIGLAGTLLPTIARLRSRPVDAIGTARARTDPVIVVRRCAAEIGRR